MFALGFQRLAQKRFEQLLPHLLERLLRIKLRLRRPGGLNGYDPYESYAGEPLHADNVYRVSSPVKQASCGFLLQQPFGISLTK